MKDETQSTGRPACRARALDLATALTALCALGMTGLALHAHLGAPATGGTGPREDRRLDDWPALASVGNRVGPGDARVEITVFSDYRCPFCRRLEEPLRWVRQAYPEDVAVVYRHLPLLGEASYLASRIAECGAEQNRFEAVHGILHRAPDISGLDLETVARDAAILDLAGFKDCVGTLGPVPRIEQDIMAASDRDIRAVPAVVFEGTLLSSPPDSATLMALVREELEKEGS